MTRPRRDAELRQKMAQAGCARAEAHFDTDKLVERLEKVLLDVAADALRT